MNASIAQQSLLVHPALGARVLEHGVPATTSRRIIAHLRRPLPGDQLQQAFEVQGIAAEPGRLSSSEFFKLQMRRFLADKHQTAVAAQRFLCSSALDAIARDPAIQHGDHEAPLLTTESTCASRQSIAKFHLRPTHIDNPVDFPAIFDTLQWWRLGAEVALARGKASVAHQWLSSSYAALQIYRNPKVMRAQSTLDQYRIAILWMQTNERLGDLQLDQLYSTPGPDRSTGSLGSIRGHYAQAMEPFVQLTALHTGIHFRPVQRMIHGFLRMANDIPVKYDIAERAVATHRARLIPPTTPPAAPSA